MKGLRNMSGEQFRDGKGRRSALSGADAALHVLRSAGFTLLELMIVLAIMGILVSIAQPQLSKSIVRAREAVLREDLFQMRDAIDQYYADNGKYPGALQDLINQQEKSRSYLRDLPIDPFTKASDWITVTPESEGGVFDVHSASDMVALDGSAYNTW
jgi:general secretion pathway protein G